jgi:imidazolonepropionase-like amidohydrolase
MKKRIQFLRIWVAAALISAMVLPQVQAEEMKEPNQILITNVNVWDGVNDDLKQNVDVLVVGNKIKRIGKIKAPKAKVIDGGDKTLIPGLTDAHVHLMINNAPAVSIYEDPWAYVGHRPLPGHERC